MNCTCTRETGCFGGIKVHSSGPEDSVFVIVGESPGPIELAQRKPFVGPSGKVLEETLNYAYDFLKIPPEQRIKPLLMNAIECFPRNKDPDTLAAATRSCMQRVNAEVRKHPRKLIVALGNAACWSLSGDFGLKITKIRGTRIASSLAQDGIVALYHPAYMLRGNGNYKQFRADMVFALELLYKPQDEIVRVQGATMNVAYSVVDTQERLRELIEKLKALPKGSAIGADIETATFDFAGSNEVLTHYPSSNPILCLGLFWGKDAYIVEPEFLTNELFQNHLQYVWHNGKFDIKFFWNQGINARVDHDTMLMSYSLNERRGIHDLDQVASDHLGTPMHKDMLEKFLSKKSDSYANIPKRTLYQYLAYDVYKTWALYRILYPKVERDPHSSKLYTKLFIPATAYLARIEMNGLFLDVPWTNQNLAEMTLEANKYEANLNSIALEVMGKEINPRSWQQVAELLYRNLRLAREGTPTDADTLAKLPQHPAVVNLLKYRKVHKGLSTYVVSALENVRKDGCVHTTFLLHGTATGRLASRQPNVQNIPRNPRLRGQYIPREGFVFIEPDLNQAELRSLACLSGDEELCRIYNTEGMSLHDEVRDFIFGTPKIWTPEQLAHYIVQFDAQLETPDKTLKRLRDEQKMIAKNVNFGIVYGITEAGLSEQIERPASEAAKYIAAWFARFPKAKQFIDRCMWAAANNEDIITVYGRKKRSGLVTWEKLRDLQNEAANFPHQATASDIMLDTGIRVEQRLRTQFKTTVHNTVHDSVLLMTPRDLPLIKEVTQFMIEELQSTPKMVGLTRVPFKADAKIGTRWGSLSASEEWIKAEENKNEH